MPESHRPVLTPAGLRHPRVKQFLAVKRHPPDRGPAGPITLEGTWLIGQALLAGVRFQAVFVCPALRQGAEGLALARQAMDLGAEGYEVS